jgi:ABC-type nitrate/sulfonate/bicarbonate transport system ATPase subunit
VKAVFTSPFGALDALTREQMNLEMLRIWQASGKTIIFVTHDIQEAVFLASHCAVLTARPARMAKFLTVDSPIPAISRSRRRASSAHTSGRYTISWESRPVRNTDRNRPRDLTRAGFRAPYTRR